MQISIEKIRIMEGRRRLDTAHVKELAGSIRELGLLNPVTIDKEYVLIAGLHRLTSGLAYQRPVNPKEVERLVREWDERLLDFVTVSYRDGRFNVVDGQHRISALRQMNGGRGVMVSCRVYDRLTYEQEAELCYKLDKAKKRLSLSQSTNALVESGMDPEALEIRRLVEECGFTWALGRKHGKTGEIVATRALVNAYRMLGGAAFTRMLCLLRDTWRGSAGVGSLRTGLAGEGMQGLS